MLPDRSTYADTAFVSCVLIMTVPATKSCHDWRSAFHPTQRNPNPSGIPENKLDNERITAVPHEGASPLQGYQSEFHDGSPNRGPFPPPEDDVIDHPQQNKMSEASLSINEAEDLQTEKYQHEI